MYVPVAVCVLSLICRLRGRQLRPNGDVTEAEKHQAADGEVMEMHQCKWEYRGVLKECQ